MPKAWSKRIAVKVALLHLSNIESLWMIFCFFLYLHFFQYQLSMSKTHLWVKKRHEMFKHIPNSITDTLMNQIWHVNFKNKVIFPDYWKIFRKSLKSLFLGKSYLENSTQFVDVLSCKNYSVKQVWVRRHSLQDFLVFVRIREFTEHYRKEKLWMLFDHKCISII